MGLLMSEMQKYGGVTEFVLEMRCPKDHIKILKIGLRFLQWQQYMFVQKYCE